MSNEIYFKNVADLSRNELLKIYDSIPEKVYPCRIPVTDKKSLVLNILEFDENFVSHDKKYHFEKSSDGNFLTYLPNHNGPCDQKFAKSHHKINGEQIQAAKKAENLSALMASLSCDESDSDSLPGLFTGSSSSSSESDDAEKTILPKTPKQESKAKAQKMKKEGAENTQKPTRTKKPSRTKIPTPMAPVSQVSKLRVKPPRYDATIPIPSWLKNLEIYAHCSKLNDNEIITVALTSLLNESEGSHVIQSLEAEDLNDWSRFKTRLLSMLGKTNDFYKNEFRNYSRGSDSFGMCLSKLISLYKQGYDIKYLGDNDKLLIIERFCESQNSKIRELLMREKSTLTIENIATRAGEIEAAIPIRELNFNISAEEKTDSVRELTFQVKQMLKMNSEAQKESKSRKTSSGDRKKIDTTKLQGHCLSYQKRKKCRYNKNCKYLHSDNAPKEVIDYVKSIA
jgi:hypothetical protein